MPRMVPHKPHCFVLVQGPVEDDEEERPRKRRRRWRSARRR